MTEKVDTESLIIELDNKFKEACENHNNALKERESNRAKKELLRGNSRGTRIYDYEVKFSWILHDIRMGPIAFIEENKEKAERLITEINKITEKA